MDWNDNTLWPPQERGLNELAELLATPQLRACVTLPTGGGKTRMMQCVLKLAGFRQLLLTGRKMLLEQTARVLTEGGIEFGIRASGYDPDHSQRIQLAMIQTEYARRGKMPRHACDIVHVDECHSHTANQMAALREYYRDAKWIGWTATPLDLEDLYNTLIVAGNMEDLRRCGAIVPAIHFGPDEPDMTGFKHRTKTGEYRAKDVVKAIRTHHVFGRVVKFYHKLNPEQHPTILFAPGVPESLWFAQRLWSMGVNAAHVDGDNVWMDGTMYESDHAARDAVAERSKAGEVKIVCNRFVLREGIDWPWIRHGIFATIFGSIKSYLQSGGRVLRQYYVDGVPQLERVTIQDHGGNWWRHGSLNASRVWRVGADDYTERAVREELMRRKKIPDPIVCPRCAAVRLSGPKCHECGYEHELTARRVIEHDGTIREHRGDILRPRVMYGRPDVERKWTAIYWRAHNADMTFAQARGLFQYENNYRWPPDNLPLMPRRITDWFEKVRNVPREELYGWDRLVRA